MSGGFKRKLAKMMGIHADPYIKEKGEGQCVSSEFLQILLEGLRSNILPVTIDVEKDFWHLEYMARTCQYG